MRKFLLFVVFLIYTIATFMLSESTDEVTDPSDKKRIAFAGVLLFITPYILPILALLT